MKKYAAIFFIVTMFFNACIQNVTAQENTKRPRQRPVRRGPEIPAEITDKIAELQKKGDAAGLFAYWESVDTGRYWSVDNNFAEALASIDKAKLKPAVMNALKSPFPSVTLFCCRFVLENEITDAVPVLLAELDKKTDTTETGKVIGALANPDPNEKFAAEKKLLAIGYSVYPKLEKHFDDKDKNLQFACRGLSVLLVRRRNAMIGTLGQLRDKRALPLLIRIIGDENEAVMVRRFTINNVALFKEAEAGAALLKLISDKNEDIAFDAIRAIGENGDKNSVPALITALENKKTKLSAIEALGKIGDPKAIPALKKIFNSDDKSAHFTTLIALAKTGDTEAVTQALANESRDKRLQAAIAIRDSGNKKMLDILLKTLKNENDKSVVMGIAGAISAMPDEKAIGAIEEAMERFKGLTANEQDHITATLIICGKKELAAPWLSELKAKEPQKRYAALIKFGKLGMKAYLPNVIELLDDKEMVGQEGKPRYADQYVRDGAINAVQRITRLPFGRGDTAVDNIKEWWKKNKDGYLNTGK